VKNEKTKVLVVYEDGREPLEAAAKRIKTSLADKAAVKTRRASEVAVAELLAADAYAFGVGDPSAPSWAEIKRLFTGINLAGRKAGFFTEAKGASDGLKAAFAPAELSVTGRDLVADQSDGTGAWAQALIAAR
jgi:hypothetical protein